MSSAPCSHAAINKFLGSRIIEQPFLRKNADFDVDCPSVVLLQPSDRIKSLQADARIDFDMGAHARRALQDRFFKGAAGAFINVVLGECALGGRDFGDRLGERSLLRFAAVKDAGLVEMNMGFDKAGDHESAGDDLPRVATRHAG